MDGGCEVSLPVVRLGGTSVRTHPRGVSLVPDRSGVIAVIPILFRPDLGGGCVSRMLVVLAISSAVSVGTVLCGV